METHSQILLTIGGILLLGLFTSALAQRTVLPRATLLLIFGMLIGQQGADLIPTLFTDLFDIISDVTLLMVGFLLGGKLTGRALRHAGSQVFWISITAALVTALMVCLVMYLLGLPLAVAIILGCIASATAPAAILDVVAESRKTGRFANLLLSIVALDDVWALLLFGVGIALVKTLNGHGGETSILMISLHDIGGATLLGLALGIPGAYLTGRIRKGQPVLTEAMGLVFLCGGFAMWLNVSYLIAAMVMGAVIANFARHHAYPFHAIEGVENNFIIIFFVLAGASLQFSALREISVLGLAYILSRFLGKFVGAWTGSRLGAADRMTGNWIGLAMLPQAGVPIGMALVAATQLPEYRQTLLSLVIASSVFFDIIGPILTRLAINRDREQ